MRFLALILASLYFHPSHGSQQVRGFDLSHCTTQGNCFRLQSPQATSSQFDGNIWVLGKVSLESSGGRAGEYAFGEIDFEQGEIHLYPHLGPAETLYLK